jgi:hypothetical protein
MKTTKQQTTEEKKKFEDIKWLLKMIRWINFYNINLQQKKRKSILHTTHTTAHKLIRILQQLIFHEEKFHNTFYKKISPTPDVSIIEIEEMIRWINFYNINLQQKKRKSILK